MITDKLIPAGVVCATILVIGATFGEPSFAGTTAATPSAAEARYQQDRANCLAGKTDEDQKTCLKEAGASLQAARQHDLKTPSQAERIANARKACDPLSGLDKKACLARAEGDGTTSGSVAGGGVLQENSVTVPVPVETMPPTAAGPAPAPAPQGN